ncbi:MAG: TonB-dependent receptor [Candidatus Latescibacteria bacterium]|nr:TonB-dependent receptor [Candidatus Latescibacterota bacterium]
MTGLDDPIVDPERVIDVELGAGFAGSIWNLQVGLYRLDFRDELIPIDGGRIQEEGRLTRANADRTLHQGIELEGTLRPLRSFSVSGNLSVSRHRYVDHEIYAYWVDEYAGGTIRYDDNTIPRTPEVLANLTADYERGPLHLNGRLRHAGKQYVDGENTESLAIDPHTVVDLLVGYDLGDRLALPRPLRIEARVNNVFDTLYETFGYSYYDDFPPKPFAFYWPGPTRSFFVSIGTTL